MTEPITVEIDATKLKQPNTGLYHFTLELTAAIERLAPQYNIKPIFLVNKITDLPATFHKKKISWFNKFFAIHNPKTKIYHSLFQLNTNKPPRRAKRLYTVHDLNFLHEKREAKQKKYLARLTKETLSADYITCISQFSKNDLLNNIPNLKIPIEVIYNGCNTSTSKPLPPQVLPAEKFLFGIGVMLPKKNWHTLPPLLIGNDLHLVLAGKFASYTDDIMNTAEKYNVAQRVHLIGEISEAHKAWYLENCEAFVFPSKAEGFGLPVVEAMIKGKPLLLSPLCSLPEIAGPLAYYFPADFNPQGMQETLKQALENFDPQQDPERLITKAKTYNWENAAHQYLKIYKQLSNS